MGRGSMFGQGGGGKKKTFLGRNSVSKEKFLAVVAFMYCFLCFLWQITEAQHSPNREKLNTRPFGD